MFDWLRYRGLSKERRNVVIHIDNLRKLRIEETMTLRHLKSLQELIRIETVRLDEAVDIEKTERLKPA